MAIDFEISKIKDLNKKRQIEDLLYSMSLKDIEYNQSIRERAIGLKKYNIKDMDALHIAFAESIKIDYIITTDKLLINAIKKEELNIKVINPIEFIMEVV